MSIPVAIDVAFEPGLVGACLARARAVGDGHATVVVAVDALTDGAVVLQQLDNGADEVALGSVPGDASRIDGDGVRDAIGGTRAIDGSDLAGLAATVASQLAGERFVLGGLGNARPLASQLAADTSLRRVLFACAGDGGRVAADDVFVAGALIRMALDELDAANRPRPQLSDAAGVAVSIALSTEEPAAALAVSDQGRRLLAREDGRALLNLCATRDLFAVVPALDSTTARLNP